MFTILDMDIYYLANWDWVFIYHFFYYSLGGIRHLMNDGKKIVLYIPYLVENKHEIDKQMILRITGKAYDIEYPMNLTGQFPVSIANLYKQMFDCIKDKVSVIYSLQDIDISNINISFFQGEDCGCFVPNQNPFFLQSLFSTMLSKFVSKSTKRIYITRKHSEFVSRHNGVKKRQVLNEEELIMALKPYNFSFIQLEDYSFEQKAELFASSEIIVAPNGGGLTFIAFANKNTKIIELFPKYNFGEYNQTYEPNYNHMQFLHVANILNLDYTRFHEMKYIDNELNIEVNVPKLLECIEYKLKQSV